MSIVLNNTPGRLYSAHGDLIYVAYEATKTADPVTYQNYKYVCDIYLGLVMVARLKAFPNPSNGRGVFNIGKVVRSYMDLVFSPESELLVQELGSEQFFVSVQCKFGEEYGDSLYTNRTIDDFRYYFNHYNGRLVGADSVLTDKEGKVASNRPYLNRVKLNGGKSFIPFFPDNDYEVEVKTYDHSNNLIATENKNYSPQKTQVLNTVNYSNSQNNSIDIDLFITYKGDDVVQKTGSGSGSYDFQDGDVITAKLVSFHNLYPWSGGTPYAYLKVEKDGEVIFYQEVHAQNTGTNYTLAEATFMLEIGSEYVVTTYSNNNTFPDGDDVDELVADSGVPYSLQIFDVSPAGINTEFTGLVNENVKYYTVQFGADDPYTFTLYCEPKYDVNTVHFLNQFGGFESFDFSKVSRKTTEAEKKSFEKLGYTINDSGQVVYSNNGVYNETKSSFAHLFNIKRQIKTDLLTDDEYIWLEELIKSPLVYLEQDGYLIPVSITTSNYETRKRINDKLTSLSIDIDYGQKFNTQFR